MATDRELIDFKNLATSSKVLEEPDEEQAAINGQFFVEAIDLVPALVDEVISYRKFQRVKLFDDEY